MKSELLSRRGYQHGRINKETFSQNSHSKQQQRASWALGDPVLLRGEISDALRFYNSRIKESRRLVDRIMQGESLQTILDQQPYQSRLSTQFEPLGASSNPNNPQEIETLFFDSLEDTGYTAEDLWVKLSWLSFYENDDSLRFRFSFGEDFAEDVAADQERQRYAGKLSNSVFPESALITENSRIRSLLCDLISSRAVEFVERIVYFNAPSGGAYLHHDRERGHAGVVYAQVSGETFWIALPSHRLVSELRSFCDTCHRQDKWPSSLSTEFINEIQAVVHSETLTAQLESFSNDTLIHLINETGAFTQYLINQGHGYTINSGDVLLLPQQSQQQCCWHSVFCLTETTGEGLSFAVRSA